MVIRLLLLAALVLPGAAWAGGQETEEAGAEERKQDADRGIGEASDGQVPEGDQKTYELMEVVVTTTRTPRIRLDTALPVGIVSVKDIEEQMPISVGDAIRELPGVSLFNHGGIYYQNPSIRGLSGRRVIMLVDGDRINSEKTMGVTGFFLNTDDVRRIEVIRGPASVMYGTDGLGGVVNVITRDPFRKPGFVARIGVAGASNNLELVNTLTLRYVAPAWFMSASGRLRDADNYASGNKTIDNSYYHDRSFRGEAGLRIGRHTLRIEGMHHFSKNIGKAANNLDDENDRRIFFPGDDVTRFTLRYASSDISNVVRRIQASAFYSYNYRHNVIQIFRDPGEWRDASIRSDKYGDIHHTGCQGMLSLEPGDNHLLTTGFISNFKNVDIYTDSVTYMPPPLDPFVSPRKIDFDDAGEFSFGVYVQDEWAPWSFLQIDLGARFDLVKGWNQPVPTEEKLDPEEMHGEDYAFSGNFGLVFHSSETTRVTLNVGRAFRAAGIQEKYLTTTTCLGMYCGDADLKPEESLNIDLGFKGMVRSLTFEVYGFNTLVDNLIAAAPQTQSDECDYRYTNTAEAWLMGGEARVSIWLEDLFFQHLDLKPFLSASYVWAKDRQSGEPIPQIPPFCASAGIRFDARFDSVVRSLYLELRVTYHDRQNRVAAHMDENGVRVEDETQTPQYILLDATAGMSLDKFWIFEGGRLNFLSENIADVAYRNHLSATEGIGRNFKLRLALDF
jgi:hemoglobin/transferrin/lactoferrin receptor protein